MGPSKQAEKAILKSLEAGASKSEQQLIQQVVDIHMTTKHVQKAIHKLCKKGKIISSENGTYSLLNNNKKRESNIETARQEPFAQFLRKQTEASRSKAIEPPKIKEEKVDIEDEIKRLEAELAADDDSESDEESEVDNVEEEKQPTEPSGKQVSFGKVQVKEIESSKHDQTASADGPAVLCLSTVAEDRIAPLPQHCLPPPRKRSLKGIDDDWPQTMTRPPKKPKVSSGLRDAVKEVLNGYVARSSERLPFYCRVCAKQYTNGEEFFAHKATEFHKTAVSVERKASFCKLCRKQFTSPVQLKEHISSRPHKERLEHVRWKQSRNIGGCRRRR